MVLSLPLARLQEGVKSTPVLHRAEHGLCEETKWQRDKWLCLLCSGTLEGLPWHSLAVLLVGTVQSQALIRAGDVG